MPTLGCVALTGLDKNIVLTLQSPQETESEIEDRIGANYKIVKVRYEQGITSRGISFQEFSKVYKPPTPIYTCIYCAGDSYLIRSEQKTEFLGHHKI